MPKLTFEIVGKPKFNGEKIKYLTGTITGKGIPEDEIGLEVAKPEALFNKVKTIHKVGKITPERLDKLIRRSDLLKEFAKALKEIRDKEKANNDYVTVWNLQEK